MFQGITYAENHPYLAELFKKARQNGISAYRSIQDTGIFKGKIVIDYKGHTIFRYQDMILFAIGREAYKGRYEKFTKSIFQHGRDGYIEFLPIFPQKQRYSSVKAWLDRVAKMQEEPLEVHDENWITPFIVKELYPKLFSLQEAIKIATAINIQFPERTELGQRLYEQALQAGIERKDDEIKGRRLPSYKGMTLVAEEPYIFLATGHVALETMDNSLFPGYIKLDPFIPQKEQWLSAYSWITNAIRKSRDQSSYSNEEERELSTYYNKVITEEDFLFPFIVREVFERITRGFQRMDKKLALLPAMKKAEEMLQELYARS